MKSKKKAYLTNEQLAEALRESKTLGQPTEKVCNYFRLIATHLLGDARYRRYPTDMQEDMSSAALLKAIKNIHNFKEEYADSCFNYYTRCIEHGFWEVLHRHYKYVNLQRQLSIDYANHFETINPALAQQIKDAQIEIHQTKDKLTFKGNKQ